MYTMLGGRHASVDRTDSLGTLSYICTQVYDRRRGSRNGLTSVSCADLGSATFAHIRPENFLFSFQGFDIARQSVHNEDGSSEIHLSPSDAVAEILKATSSRRAQVVDAVEKFRKKVKEKLPSDENRAVDEIEGQGDDAEDGSTGGDSDDE